MHNGLYRSLKPGQFGQVFWGIHHTVPVLGIIEVVGDDSLDVIFFPKTSDQIGRLRGIWRKDDPRLQNPNYQHIIPEIEQRGLFLPLPDFVAHLNLVEELHSLRNEVEALRQELKQLKQQRK
ncbi:MAG: hypothetical protein NZ821_05975 [Gloeomargarita sp. SKYB31]|nr:hypothetical protein [Gloeomargarita sp. SKYB31]